MKQYIIDELRLEDYEKVKIFFDNNLKQTSFAGIYWLPLSDDLLTDNQKEHDNCKPFYFALALSQNQISCELLIRTQNTLQCSCIEYATKKQRDWLIQYIDSMFEDLIIIA
jgi:hypothetical protein